MKKLLVLSLSVLVSLFASCSSDDDSSGGDSIVGSWQTQSISFDGGPDEANDCDRMDTVVFTETTRSFVFFDVSETNSNECVMVEEFTDSYNIEGNNIIVDGLDEDEITFEINGDTLIIIDTDVADGRDDETITTTYRRL